MNCEKTTKSEKKQNFVSKIIEMHQISSKKVERRTWKKGQVHYNYQNKRRIKKRKFRVSNPWSNQNNRRRFDFPDKWLIQSHTWLYTLLGLFDYFSKARYLVILTPNRMNKFLSVFVELARNRDSLWSFEI